MQSVKNNERNEEVEVDLQIGLNHLNHHKH